MFDEYEFDDDEPDESCPECAIGRLKRVSKPYLKLYQGQLFTVPDAPYYCCDLCGYQDVDDSTYNIISHMMFSARVQKTADDTKPPVPSPLEDESPRSSDPPRI